MASRRGCYAEMTLKTLNGLPRHSSALALVSALLAGLFLFDQDRFPLRRWPIAFAIAAAVTALAIVIVRPFDMANFRSRGVAIDSHLAVTIEMAANEAFCGVPSSIDGLGLGTAIQENPAFDDMPLRQVIEAKFGSLSSFCGKKKRPFTNNENALYFTYAAALRLWPSVSTIGLAELVTTARVLMVGFIAFAIIVLGLGVFWTFVSTLLSLNLHVILIETHVLSIYPFMTFQLAMLWGLVAIGYAAGSQLGWSMPLRLAYGAVLGLVTVAIWNMRISHGLMATLALAGVAGLLLLRGREFAAGATRWKSVAAATASCVVVGIGMHAMLLQKIADTATNAAHHPIAHPIVLGLGFPENALAKRENIRWDDTLGLELARRADPHATYLGPRYERALFSYYFDLWRKYPFEMLSIYLSKFNVAGTGIRPQTALYIGPLAYWTLKPAAWLMASGWLWLLSLMTVGLVGAILFVRLGAPAALAAAFFGAAGVMLLSEHAITLPAFNFGHFGALAEWAFLFSLGIYQLIINGCVRLVQIAQQRVFG
jgi:hypothetical protein